MTVSQILDKAVAGERLANERLSLRLDPRTGAVVELVAQGLGGKKPHPWRLVGKQGEEGFPRRVVADVPKRFSGLGDNFRVGIRKQGQQGFPPSRIGLGQLADTPDRMDPGHLRPGFSKDIPQSPVSAAPHAGQFKLGALAHPHVRVAQ